MSVLDNRVRKFSKFFSASSLNSHALFKNNAGAFHVLTSLQAANKSDFDLSEIRYSLWQYA